MTIKGGTVTGGQGTNRREINEPRFRRLRDFRQMLQAGPISMERLIEAGGVCDRTVREDIHYARHEWGWVVNYSHKTLCWEALGPLPVPVVRLDEEEALALLAAAPALKGYGAWHYATQLQRALKKMGEALETPLPTDEPSVGFELYALRPTDPRALQRVARAVRDQERVRFTYHNPETGETRVRRVDPYSLRNAQGCWYLNGYCDWREELRDFAITPARMKDLEGMGEFFERDPALEEEQRLKRSFHLFKGGEVEEVTLRFGPRQAVYQMERVLEPEEKREEQPDGTLVVRFPAPMNIGVIRWVLQYGSEVEVLSPAWLRKRIQEEAAGMAARHGAVK